MRYINSRKYPITHMKKNPKSNERSFDLSVAAAVGVLVFVFAKGVFWGYMARKWID